MNNVFSLHNTIMDGYKQYIRGFITIHDEKIKKTVNDRLRAEHCITNWFEERIITIHRLHREMDLAVLSAYGWDDIDPAHNFYEVDYLPENDRVRYTISPAARREILTRLLALNHLLHAEELSRGDWDKKKPKPDKPKKSKQSPTPTADTCEQGELF